MKTRECSLEVQFVRKYFRFFILIGMIILLVIIFGIISPPFLNLSNIMNLIGQTSVLAILSIGMTFVIISRGLDLSIGSNIAFSGVIAVTILTLTNNAVLSIIGALIGGSLIGVINGIMIGNFKISPFMTTLATMIFARGLAIGISNAESLGIDNKILLWLGQTRLGPLPITFFLIIVLYCVADRVLKHSVFGRNVYAIGGNLIASRIIGINIERHLVFIYVLNGVLVGIASVVTLGRLSSAQPWSGQGLEFAVITAVILGGTSLVGGEGSIRGTLLGVILIGLLSNGLMLLNIRNYYLSIIRGVILILALIFDNLSLRYFERLEKRSFLR